VIYINAGVVNAADSTMLGESSMCFMLIPYGKTILFHQNQAGFPLVAARILAETFLLCRLFSGFTGGAVVRVVALCLQS
jgi:hypothetical protein